MGSLARTPPRKPPAWARIEAEARQERADFLSEASAILGCSLEFAEARTQIGHLVVPRFADWMMIHVSGRGA